MSSFVQDTLLTGCYKTIKETRAGHFHNQTLGRFLAGYLNWLGKIQGYLWRGGESIGEDMLREKLMLQSYLYVKQVIAAIDLTVHPATEQHRQPNNDR